MAKRFGELLRACDAWAGTHIVPLPTQAIMTFRELHPLTRQGEYVFRGERHHDRPMSDAAVNAALRAVGFPADEVTGHGFRATARTMLAERLNVPETVIEVQYRFQPIYSKYYSSPINY